jgi:hypothetical protein
MLPMSLGLRGSSFIAVIFVLPFDTSFLPPSQARHSAGGQAESFPAQGRSAEGSLALPLGDSSLIGLP